MTTFEKAQQEAYGNFATLMARRGLEVNLLATTLTRRETVLNGYWLIMQTRPVPVKGKKKLIDELRDQGYLVTQSRHNGRSCFTVTARVPLIRTIGEEATQC